MRTTQQTSPSLSARFNFLTLTTRGPLILAAVFLAACSAEAPPEATTVAAAVPSSSSAPDYVPTPVYCADPAVSTLCSVIPSFIGDDPILKDLAGYQGLSDQVTSSAGDAQSPFDNMAWQMFIALNWQASQSGGDPSTGLTGAGPVVWQTYARPEEVFGGPVGSCANPNNLPVFNLISKSGAQDRDEGIMQATGQPLIDINGNWALFERRLNGVEQDYIVSQGLNTYAGQQAFVEASKTVLFPPGAQTPTNSLVGAIELKASWRIIAEAEKSSYFNIQALIDVEGAYVRDGNPLCETVTLGLVGLHIIQANSELGALDPKFIWASFEHKNNAPTAAAACDPVDNNCYTTILENHCPAPANAGDFSFSQNACSALPVNTPPVLAKGDSEFIWERQQPFAGAYTTTSGTQQCGTQVSRCWQVYDLTQDLNTAWTGQLQAINSVFANYFLIGTNWGASIEFEPGKLDNNAVPAFLGNTTMETYIQSDPKVGNCVGCHSFANLAYTTGEGSSAKTYPANFSFLPGLATQLVCSDLTAGPIWSNEQAQTTCPKVCGDSGDDWNGQWKTTQFGVTSVCGCCG